MLGAEVPVADQALVRPHLNRVDRLLAVVRTRPVVGRPSYRLTGETTSVTISKSTPPSLTAVRQTRRMTTTPPDRPYSDMWVDPEDDPRDTGTAAKGEKAVVLDTSTSTARPWS